MFRPTCSSPRRRPATPARPALRLESLETRDTPSITAFGAGPGGGPRVQVFNQGGQLIADFLAYDAAFRGGVNVAVGDVTGDGFDDVVTTPGPGGGPNVKVFAGTGFRQFGTSPGPGGGPFVQTGQTGIDSANPVASFFAYDPAFSGGVSLAVGNVDPSNDFLVKSGSALNQAGITGIREEIVVAPLAGGGPNVKVFGNTAAAPTFSAATTTPGTFDPMTGMFTQPTTQATTDEINAAKFAVVIDGTKPISSFLAYDESFRGGVNLDVGSLNGFPRTLGRTQGTNGQAVYQLPEFPAVDEFEDIVVGPGSGSGPNVKVFKNLSTQDQTTGAVTFKPFAADATLASFFALDPAFQGGVTVAVADQNGDGQNDLVVGAGKGGGPEVRVYTAKTVKTPYTNPPYNPASADGSIPTTGSVRTPTDYGASAFINQSSGITDFLLFDGFKTDTPFASFMAADPSYTGGVRVEATSGFGVGGGAGQPATITVSFGAGLPAATVTFSNQMPPAPFPITSPTAPPPFAPLPSAYNRTQFGSIFDLGFNGGLFVDQNVAGFFA